MFTLKYRDLSLEQETLKNIESLHYVTTVEELTKLSKLTKHESRIGNVCRKLYDKHKITVGEYPGRNGNYKFGYRLA